MPPFDVKDAIFCVRFSRNVQEMCWGCGEALWTWCVLSSVKGRILVIEAEADTHHQIIRVTEVLQVIPDVQIRTAGHLHFECQYLVDTFMVTATVQYIGSYAHTYCEVGHYIFCASGNT